MRDWEWCDNCGHTNHMHHNGEEECGYPFCRCKKFIRER